MRPSALFLGSLALAVLVPATASAGDDFFLKIPAPDDPDAVYGGTEVEPCGWPTTVSMQGNCTGTLVHPEVVIYAAHCGSGFSSVQLGEEISPGNARSVPTEYCRTYPGGGTNGSDFAFCKLAEPQDDIQIVPPLMGCEADVLVEGQEVVVVGYGNADNGPYGIKREVYVPVMGAGGGGPGSDDCANTGSPSEICVGGAGKDSCQGDSGGPVYVKLPTDYGIGSWRVFGITSWGGACGTGGWYSQMHNGMEWFESESGIDLTPCHDADGTWNPGPECFGLPMDPASTHGNWSEGCGVGPVGAYESSCGEPFNSEPDDTAPTVTITMPSYGDVFDSDPLDGNQAAVSIVVTADDGDGWGVQSVQLIVDGADVPGGEDFAVPYEWNAKFPPGIYELGARATDYAGNTAMAEVVVFGVDMEPPPPPDPTTTSDGGTGSGSGGTESTSGGTESSSGGIDTDGGSAGNTAGAAGGDDGCGCTTGKGGAPLGSAVVLLGLVALRRRRR